MDKEQMAIERIRTASEMSLAVYGLPLVVTTSGGKDSSVCIALAERAGIPFEVLHSHTTADAPEKGSSSRRKNREIYEAGRNVILNSDNDDRRRLFETCALKAKRVCDPIIDWTDADVWDYINSEHLTLNPLYQCRFYRVGCIGCPLVSKKCRVRNFARYPKYREMYIRAFDKMLEARRENSEIKTKYKPWETGMEGGMRHLGDITDISGYDVPPVDVVVGGSLCQDLGTAGKRAGLAGERSGPFTEQIRLIKGLRNADMQRGRADMFIRLRFMFMLWENVPGAFSSNKGNDFRAILEETIRIAEPDAPDVPLPAKGKWLLADCWMGEGMSAWPPRLTLTRAANGSRRYRSV